jgi:hypothetical protein
MFAVRPGLALSWLPRRPVLLVLPVLAFLGFAAQAHASFDSIPAESLVANGPVEAMAVSGETLYLGGAFSTIGPRTGLGVPFSSDLATRDRSVPQVSGPNGTIYATISDGAGGWYVGGKFTSVGGDPRSDLVHILANDTVDPSFKPEPDGAVRELELSGSTLYVGGQFDKIAGQTRNGLAALETATGAANAFNPITESDPAYYGEFLCGLAVDGNYIFVCGGFTEIGGQKRNGLALLNISDGSATGWNPENRDRPLLIYLSPEGVLYLGGFSGEFLIEPTKLNKFNEPKRVYHQGVAALKLASEVTAQPTPLEFNPQFRTPGFFSEEPVTSFLQVGSTLYIGGRFVALEKYGEEPNGDITYSEEPHDRVLAVNPSENYAIGPFEPSPNNEVTALAAAAGHLYIAGNFSQVGGTPRLDLAAVNPVSAALEGANPEIDGRVGALAVSESGVYVGGSITTVGGASRQDLAAIDIATGKLEEFDPGVEVGSGVEGLAVSASTLYVGGSFRDAIGAGEGAQGRNNLAAFEISDGKLTTFAPETNGTVSALALSGSTLFAGGSFSEVHGVAHGSLAAFSTVDGSTEAFNPKPNGSVNALALSSGRLYAAGSFSELSGESGTPARDDLAAFDLPTETLDTSFLGPSFDGALFALAANESSVYVGGDFSNVGTTYQPRLAALNVADGSMRKEWNPEVSNDVDSLLLDGSTLYAGGDFGQAGGAARPGVAGLSTATGGVTPFDPEPGPDVRALALGPSALYIGGTFTEVGGVDDTYFATFPSGSLAEEEARYKPGSGEAGSGESSSEGSDVGSTPLASTPGTFITRGPSYYTSARVETFTFGSDVEGASFRCSLDGAPATVCSSPYTTGTLGLGAHRFVVQAVDPAGDVDLAGVSESFVVVEPSAAAAAAASAAASEVPVLSHVKLPARIVRASAAGKHKQKQRKRVFLSFSSSEAATVTISLRRIVRVGCGRRRSCTRLRAAGTIAIHARAGSNRVSFPPSVRGKVLRAGSYSATLVARNTAAAVSSKPVTVRFRLVAGG